MATKSALPLIAVAAAATMLLMPKKKKGTRKSPSTSEDPDIVLAGTSQGWWWQVRKVTGKWPDPEVAYFGEVRPDDSAPWTQAMDKGVPKASTAKAIALEYIHDASQSPAA